MSVTASNTKVLAVVQPAVIKDNASWTTVEIDAKDWEYCTFYFQIGATDIAHVALKLQESATSGSGMVDVVGAIFGTSNGVDGTASTLPSATDDNTIVAIDVDLRARQRYLDVVATAGNGAAGTYMSGWCVLSRGHSVPQTPTERGLGQLLRV